MSKEGLVPKLRFEEFEKLERWYEYSLEELIEVNNGRDYKHLKKGDIPVYGTGGQMTSVNAALSYEKDAIGIGRKGTIDKPYILRAPYWTVDTLFYAIPKIESNISFFYGIFKNINWLAKQESTGVPSLSKAVINKVKISIPDIPEQLKVGRFFMKLDQMIELQRAKVNKVKDIKSAYLSEMFPKEGVKYPKKRFEGFTGPWEQSDLREFKFYISDGNYGELYPKADEFIKVGIPFLRVNNLKNGYLTRKDLVYISPILHSKLLSGHLMERDILITTRGQIGKIAYVDREFQGSNINAQICLIRTGNKMSPEYLHQYLQTEDSQRQIISLQSGSALKQLPRHRLNKVSIKYPISRKEQEKIGKFFHNVDNQISIEEEKLDKLEKLKQAYLNDMFV